MDGAQLNDRQSDIKKSLGIIFLLIAFSGLYWVAGAIQQLWNSPESVPFVATFIDLLEENQAPIIRSVEGGEINLPASWPVAVGIFLSIVLISSVGLLIRCFLSNALLLLFPGMPSPKGVLVSTIERIKNKKRERP